MSGIDRNDFNERLRRIEAERRGIATPPPLPGAHPAADPLIRTIPRRRGWGLPVVLLIAVLGLGALAAYRFAPITRGYLDVVRFLPEWRAHMARRMAPPAEEALPAGADGPPLRGDAPAPASAEAGRAEAARGEAGRAGTGLLRPALNGYRPVAAARTTERMGLLVGDEHAVGADLAVMPLSAITTDPRPTGPGTPVASVTPFAANQDCHLRGLRPGERLVNVNVQYATREAPVQLLRPRRMVRQLIDGLEDTLLKGRPVQGLDLEHGLTGVIDVYLTDTSAPLYLALQSPARNRLWVLHAAPGVKLAHVALIGQGASAVAGDLGAASIEAIRAEEFGFSTDTEMLGRVVRRRPECMPLPYQKPDESWGAWAAAEQGNTMDGNMLYAQSQGYEVYAKWFSAELPSGPEANLIRAAGASAVLVGPVPAQPLAPAGPADGLAIRLAGAELAVTGDPATRAAGVEARYREMLTRAAGRDLAQVIPPERVFDQPAPPAPQIAPPKAGLMGRALGIDSFTRDPNLRLLDPLSSSDARRVTFEGSLAFADLLAPGEAEPPEDERLLYALLRAPRQIETHCAETVSEIALRCRIDDYRVWLTAAPEPETEATGFTERFKFDDPRPAAAAAPRQGSAKWQTARDGQSAPGARDPRVKPGGAKWQSAPEGGASAPDTAAPDTAAPDTAAPQTGGAPEAAADAAPDAPEPLPIVRYRVTFGYAPNYPITGREIDPGATGYGFVSGFLPDTNLAHRYDTPEARRAYLRHLRAICDVLRAEYGACLVEAANFAPEEPTRFQGGARTHAAGWVSVFAADNPFMRQQVEARIEALAAEMAP